MTQDLIVPWDRHIKNVAFEAEEFWQGVKGEQTAPGQQLPFGQFVLAADQVPDLVADLAD